nr:hypothetical protein [Candidatus Sigynarchaeota archaeon]
MISIGARYHAELDFEASNKILNEQKEKMESTIKIIDSRVQQLAEQAEKVRPVLEQQLDAYQKRGTPGQGMPPSKINLDDI